MYEILDKILLLICCAVWYLLHYDMNYAIIPIIIAVSLSSLTIYYDNLKMKLASNLVFLILCIFIPEYIIFEPLLLYDIFHTKYQPLALISLLVVLFHGPQYSFIILSLPLIFTLVSYLLKLKTDKLNGLQFEYNELRDNSVKMSRLLEEKNQSLLKNQDYEINLATLNERNRISKEIHDHIGHLLSRAILQVGALLTISKEKTIKEGLSELKNSLSDGMDQIRNSIHQMYDESVDLYAQIEKLVKEFTFCPIGFDYDIKTPPALSLKHAIIAIIKEALSNTIRHSNASKVSIIVREHPALYQLIIHDNGSHDEKTKKKLHSLLSPLEYEEGMGLKNISDRVRSFDGNFHISCDQGFRIFITIPKDAK